MIVKLMIVITFYGGSMRILFILLMLISVNAFALKTASQVLNNVHYKTYPTALLTSAQSFTNAWASAGAQFDCEGAKSVAAWLDVDINSSTNPRVRMLGYMTTSGASYVMPIKTVSASDIKVEDHYVELNDDADQKIVVDFEISRHFEKCRFEIQDSNGSNGGINSLYYTIER